MVMNKYYRVHYYKSGNKHTLFGKYIGINVLRFPIFESNNARFAIPPGSIYRIVYKQEQL
jgi:hypothetical protein